MPARTEGTALRVGMAGAAVVGVAFGMGRFAFGLTLSELRADPALSSGGLSDLLLGLIASATFAGFLAGVVGTPRVARRLGPRAPTTLGGACGALGSLLVVAAPGPGLLSLGTVLVGSAAGWVWAPYNDLVAAVAVPARRPGLLAIVSTGTSAGLVAVGLVAVVVPGWRAVWAAVGLASTAAAVLNLVWTPRVAPVAPGCGGRSRCVPWRPLLVPALYTVGYSVTTTLFFTYAADTLRRAGLSATAGPTLYMAIGVLGLVALLTGRWCGRIGARRVAGSCLGLVATALAVLGLGAGSWPAALLAAVVFAPGYMAGAAVIAVWTSALVPEAATEAMTGVLTAGALAAVVGPTVVGALIVPLGMSMVLVGLATPAAVGAVVLLVPAAATRPHSMR